MFQQKIKHLLPLCSRCGITRNVFTTPSASLIQKWRSKKGLPMNPNARGTLTDSPDYSFIDGRLTPIGVGQKKRLVQNVESRDQIIALTKEIDFAVERHKQMQIEEKRRKEAILDSKLKPKGLKLLKND